MAATEVFFVPAARGQRFGVLDLPAEGRPVRGTILFVHPWAEELNKSRRAVALGSRALAREGWAVLRIDLYGCGDSSGLFGGATWAMWREDVAVAARWLSARFQLPPRLWGLRAGCLLIADYLAKGGESNGVTLWQPVVSGRQHLAQFLRLRMANEMLGNAVQRSGLRQLRERIAAGERVEVAGYPLSEGLAEGLEQTDLLFKRNAGTIHWLEISSADPPALLPASTSCIDKLRQDGARVDAAAVSGPVFWQTVEIAECPALVAKTVELVCQ